MNQKALNNKVAYLHSMFFRTVSDLINYPSYFCLFRCFIYNKNPFSLLFSLKELYFIWGVKLYIHSTERQSLKEKKCKTIFSMAQGNVML